MKYIIDLIEDIREQISNKEDYVVTAGLLKADEDDSTKLVYAGEALINQAILEDDKKELRFTIDASGLKVTTGALIPPLLIQDTHVMMYELRMDVNEKYKNMEIVGFGKNDEEKKYILFIKI